MGRELHHAITIQGYHIDVNGHVNNAVYHQWMDEARTKLLAEMDFLPEDDLRHAVLPALAHTEIDYLHPITIGGQVHIALWISVMRHGSAEVQIRFYTRHGTLCARAMKKALFVRANDGKPWRIPDELRAKMARYLIEG